MRTEIVDVAESEEAKLRLSDVVMLKRAEPANAAADEKRSNLSLLKMSSEVNLLYLQLLVLRGSRIISDAKMWRIPGRAPTQTAMMLVHLLPKNTLFGSTCELHFLESCQLGCCGLKIRAEQTADLQRVHENQV